MKRYYFQILLACCLTLFAVLTGFRIGIGTSGK